MYHFCDKIYKGKFDLHTWKLIFKRELSLRDRKLSTPLNRQLLNVNTSIHCIQTNYFKSVQQGTPLNQNLLNLVTGKSFTFSRNFSISKSVKSAFGRTQDKEKLKNFIFFGVLFIIVVGVQVINLKLKRHQDNIFIGTEEPRRN